MKLSIFLGLLILTTVSAQAAPRGYDAICRIEHRDLHGELVGEVKKTVKLNIVSPSHTGYGKRYAGILQSPIENILIGVSIDINDVTFTTDISYARKDHTLESYLEQANQGDASPMGYRAPGNITYGQSQTRYFEVSQVKAFKFFQENNFHAGTYADNGEPNCYPTCPPRGPYDGPYTQSLPQVGKLNVFCRIKVIQ